MYTTVQLEPGTSVPSAPAPIRSRRRGLHRVGLTALALTAVAGSMAVTAHAIAKEDTSHNAYQGIRTVVLDVDAGTIDLTAAPDATTGVTASRRWAYQAPPNQPVRDGDRLTITAHCPDIEQFAAFGTCHTNYQLAVPAGVRIQVTTSAGNITATDLPTTDLAARTSAGDITLSFTNIPNSVRAHTSAGDVQLAVPYGDYHVDADTSAGDIHVGVVDDPRAPRLIDVQTSAGDIRVDPR
jgi:putative adhesin